MEGNWLRDGTKAKFPSAEGWHDTGPRENAIFVGGCAGVVIVSPDGLTTGMVLVEQESK